MPPKIVTWLAMPFEYPDTTPGSGVLLPGGREPIKGLLYDLPDIFVPVPEILYIFPAIGTPKQLRAAGVDDIQHQHSLQIIFNGCRCPHRWRVPSVSVPPPRIRTRGGHRSRFGCGLQEKSDKNVR